MSRRAAIALAATLLALLVFPFPHFEALRSPNELSRLFQARAIVDHGTLALNPVMARLGMVGDVAVKDGRYYPNKAPGVSLLGAALYAPLRSLVGPDAPNRAVLFVLRLFLAALPTALVCLALARLVEQKTGDGVAALVAGLVLGAGTLLRTYGGLLFGHALTAALLGGGYALAAQEAPSTRRGLWVGLLLGGAVVVEYTSAPMAAVVAGYAAWRWRARGPVAALIASAFACAVALSAYHWAAFGGPFRLPYQHNANATFQSWHDQGLMGLAGVHPRWLLGNLFSPGRGLFAFAPALVLALPGIALLWRRSRADALVSIAALAVYGCVAASFVYEGWGWMVGPRHLTALVPFLALPLGEALAWARARGGALARGVAGGLAAASILITTTASAVYPHYPEDYGNGFFDLTLPLIARELLPYNLLEIAAGAVATSTWFPYAALLLGAAAWPPLALCRERPRRLGGLALAALVFSAHLLALSRAARLPAAEREARLARIQADWEPVPHNVRRGLFAHP